MNLKNSRGQAYFIASFLLLVSSMNVASGDPVLIAAVKKQDTATARELIARNVDVNRTQADGATALHWAVHRDDLEIAKLLVKAGADVNKTNAFGVMPISLAATNRNASIIEILLNAGADANATLLTGETVLMRAAHTGDLDSVDILLKHGADINAMEPVRNQTALMWALAEKHAEVARRLIEQGADIHAKTTLRFTPLMFAAREGDLEATEILLDAGADVNAKALKMRDQRYLVGIAGEHLQDENGMAALHVATVRGHSEVAALLLEHGADPNYKGPGYTPLHWAAGTWETEMNGANGMTAPKGHEWDRMRGVQEGKYELVKALLEHGADPNALIEKTPSRLGFQVFKHKINETPLWLAAFACEPEIMRLLVDHGADMDLRSESGVSVLMIAAGVSRFRSEYIVPEERALETVKMALELGADVNETDPEGNTAMHGAAFIRSTKIVQFLADSGADVNALNEKGHSPIHVAEHDGRRAGTGAEVEHSPVLELLRELSVPDAVKKSIEEWANIPRHVRDAIESLLSGELEKMKDEKK